MAAHTEEEIRRSVRTYLVVFVALATLTLLTVLASYLHLPTSMTIIVALLIACTKGSLVAMFFMHLIDERKAIYWILVLTVVFFAVLMFLPMGSYSDMRRM